MGMVIMQALIGALIILSLSVLYVRNGSNEGTKGILGWFVIVPSFAICLYLSAMVVVLYVVPLIF